MSRRESFSLLFAILLTACGPGRLSAPDLPESVAPGWKRTPMTETENGTENGVRHCFATRYSGPGTADLSLCHYQVEAAAFDALQRTPAAAQAVKFQEGNWFVLIKWKDAPKASLTALIRTIQKSLNKSER